MGKLLLFAKRRGFHRGVMGNDRRWLAVWAAIAVTGFVRKKANGPVQVERFTLKPGQTIQVTDTGVPNKPTRRQQRKLQASSQG